MRAILVYDLPSEQWEHRCAVAAGDLASGIVAIDERLRSMSKHEGLEVVSIGTIREWLRDDCPAAFVE